MKRLRRARWLLKDIQKYANKYKSRGEWQIKHQKSYMAAYSRGLLDQFTKHMKSSQKRNKFVVGTFDYASALGKTFLYENIKEFRTGDRGAFYALERYGVNIYEFFQNREDSSYVKNVARDLMTLNKQRFIK